MNFIKNWLLKQSVVRKPDVKIGPQADPYMERWFIIPRNRFFNVYLHLFHHSDDDRALHNHPWLSLSWVLLGKYKEITPEGVKVFEEGSLIFRNGKMQHRIELFPEWTVDENGLFFKFGPKFEKVWTLFITGPKFKEWGFFCPQGFVHWSKFTNPKNSGETGRGCDQ